MKTKLLLLSCVTALFVGNASAQFDPISKELFQSIWTEIVAHDSIVYSEDTGSAFFAFASADIEFMANGKYDSLNFFTMDTINVIYDGEVYADSIVILGYSSDFGSMQAVEKNVFHLDASGRDSVMEIFVTSGPGMPWQSVASISLEYSGGNQISELIINANLFGSVFPLFEYEYHYTGNLVDSIEMLDIMTFTKTGLIKNNYNGNVLISSETYADTGTGEMILAQVQYFDHNTAGEIIQVTNTMLDSTSGTFVVDISWKYLTGSQPLSVKENPQTLASIYPNPAVEELHINSRGGDFTSYEIYSVDGRIVMSGSFSEIIRVSSLENGQYFLRLDGTKGMSVQPFVKR